MTNIVPLQTRWHEPPVLPLADSIPIGSETSVVIEPWREGWSVIACSGDGAIHLGAKLTKREALRIAVAFVEEWNAELILKNDMAAH